MQPLPLRLGRWGSSILPHGTRPCALPSRNHQGYSYRFQSSAQIQVELPKIPAKRARGRPKKETTTRPLKSAKVDFPAAGRAGTVLESAPEVETPSLASAEEFSQEQPLSKPAENITQSQKPSRKPARRPEIPRTKLITLPSPPPARASTSAKLSALHARLALPSQLPLETLARCLVDKSADPDPRFNNHHLSNLGNDLLGYYMGEHLICHYPRLPMVVLEAAILAHVGPKASVSLAQSWGVETAAEPGGEVDPGLLQFRRVLPSKRDENITKGMMEQAQERAGTFHPILRTLEVASACFVRAVVASVYLHGGAERVKDFFRAHFQSRHLDLHSLFSFTEPTRDLSRLCAREGFESPIARIISETGRASRHPVFVVGVFSGRDKIGEDAGASLNEARFKAAAKALKGWYLYSPRTAIGGGEIMVPSMMEGEAGKSKSWRKPHIDDGEVIV